MSKLSTSVTGMFVALFLILSACQAASPAPTAVPLRPAAAIAPTPFAAPTRAPQHPEARPDASRIDFSTKTMISSPGKLDPNTSIQGVFNVEAGRKISIRTTIESGSWGALSLWGADGTVLIPELAGITEWEGTLPTAQDYYLNFRNTAQEPLTYRLIIKMAPLVQPQATRIQFKSNATGGSTQGELPPNGRMSYVLGIMAGQQMTVSVKTASPEIDAYLYIWGADGTVFTLTAPVKEWSGFLPVTQDYYVEIVSASSSPVAYELSINIPPINTPMAPPTQVETGPKIAKDDVIRFTAGVRNVEKSGAVISTQRDRYTLSAITGETLDVQITSPDGNAVFTILGPDNNALPGTEEGKNSKKFTGTITTDGTYIILVGSTRGNATYTLKVNL